jgi:hypothetical protein
MHRIATAALAAAIVLVPAVAVPQVAFVPGTHVFATVDAVGQDGTIFSVTGLLQGGATPSTRSAYSTSSDLVVQQCQRYALLAQAKPGQYLFEMTVVQSFAPNLEACSLRRATP